MAIQNKNNSTVPVNRDGLGLTFTSSNQKNRPVVYSEDVWSIVSGGTEIAALLSGVTGSYTDESLFEEIAHKINTINVGMVNISGGDGGNILPQSITDYNLATNSVTTVKIKDANVTHSKIADGAVGTNNIATSAITADKLADEIISTSNIVDLSVTNGKISNDAVTTEKIANGNVTHSKIADDAINANNISASAVTEDELASNSVTTVKIKDANVTHSKIADDAVWANNILSGSVLNEKIADGAVNTRTLSDESVTNAKIADEAVKTRNLYNESVTNEKIADGTIIGGNISGETITDFNLAPNSVTTVKITDGNVTRVKLAQEIDDYLLTQQMKDYLNKQLQGQREDEAKALYTLTQTGSGTTYFVYGTDLEASAEKQTVVTIKFSGSTVAANTTPTGWTHDTQANDYKVTLAMSGIIKSVGAANFSYTIPNSIPAYSGITVTKTSSSASIKWKYPVYYGLVSTTDASSISSSVSGFTYSAETINTTVSIENASSSSKYLCILSKGSGSVEAKQLGNSILNPNATLTNVSFVSPKNSLITMTGYTAYFSDKTAGAGLSFDNVELKATVVTS